MFEAGRSSFVAFSSKRVCPVSSDTTFKPTMAEANSGFASTSEIFDCNSGSVRAAATFNGVGEGDGEGLGWAAGACCCESALCGTAAIKTKNRTEYASSEVLCLYIEAVFLIGVIRG